MGLRNFESVSNDFSWVLWLGQKLNLRFKINSVVKGLVDDHQKTAT